MNTTKIYTMAAVLMLAFVGVIGFVGADANDAVTDDATKLTVTYDGVISPAEAKALFEDGASVSYVAALADDIEDRITVLNMDDYKTYIKPIVKQGYITIDLATIDGTTVTISENVTIAYDDLMDLVAQFADVETDKLGEIIGGMDTVIEVNVVGQTAKKAVEVIKSEDAVAAVEAAILETIADYADYKSPEEVKAAIADATAKYRDYVSPEDYQKAIDDAKKGNDAQAWMIVAIFAIIAAAGMAGFLVYTLTKTKKVAKKAD